MILFFQCEKTHLVLFYGAINEIEVYKLPECELEKLIGNLHSVKRESLLMVRRRMDRKYGKHNEELGITMEQYMERVKAKLDFCLQMLKVSCQEWSYFDM